MNILDLTPMTAKETAKFYTAIAAKGTLVVSAVLIIFVSVWSTAFITRNQHRICWEFNNDPAITCK